MEDDVYEPFKERLVAAVEELEVLDPRSDGCKVGPVIESSARDSALDAIGRSDGAVMTGGSALDSDGFYHLPTLVEVKDPASILATKEVFAPVAAVMRAPSPEVAVDIANDTDYGLVASVFTSDLARHGHGRLP